MNNTIAIKPLSNHMIETLMDCHERELMNLEPYDAGALPHCRGLIERGLLGTKIYVTESGKKIMACYVTNPGRRYLSNL